MVTHNIVDCTPCGQKRLGESFAGVDPHRYRISKLQSTVRRGSSNMRLSKVHLDKSRKMVGLSKSRGPWALVLAIMSFMKLKEWTPQMTSPGVQGWHCGVLGPSAPYPIPVLSPQSFPVKRWIIPLTSGRSFISIMASGNYPIRILFLLFLFSRSSWRRSLHVSFMCLKLMSKLVNCVSEEDVSSLQGSCAALDWLNVWPENLDFGSVAVIKHGDNDSMSAHVSIVRMCIGQGGGEIMLCCPMGRQRRCHNCLLDLREVAALRCTQQWRLQWLRRYVCWLQRHLGLQACVGQPAFRQKKLLNAAFGRRLVSADWCSWSAPP